MKRTRRKPLSPEEREQKAEFDQATYGRPCANCGRGWTFGSKSHHVIEAQELKDRHLPVWDQRNALALCPDCHANHHSASRRVPFRKLRAANIDYAYETLGPFAADYLRKKYPMQDQPEEKGT